MKPLLLCPSPIFSVGQHNTGTPAQSCSFVNFNLKDTNKTRAFDLFPLLTFFGVFWT